MNELYESEQQSQEPVAWKYKRLDGEITATVNKNFALIVELDGYEVTPLYTHPAPQPAQEPVAWCVMSEYGEIGALGLNGEPNKPNYAISLYTHPKQWQGLTEDEIDKAFKANHCDDLEDAFMCGVQFAEVMLKEKNA